MPRLPPVDVRWAAVLVAALLRAPCLLPDTTFVYDDRKVLLDNLLAKGRASVTDIVRADYWGTPMTSPFSHGSWRPWTSLSFWFTARLFSSDDDTLPPAVVYHAISFILHVCVSWAASTFALALLRWLHALLRHGTADHVPNQHTLKLWTCAIVLMHPVNVEAVCSIASRGELMAAACTMRALTMLLNMATDHIGPSPPGFASASTQTLMAACWGSCALLCKETGVVALLLPPLLLAVSYVADPRSPASRNLLHLAAQAIAFCGFVLAVRLAVQMWRVPAFFSPIENPVVGLPLVPRLLTASYLLMLHASMLVWPLPCVDYSYLSIPPLHVIDPRTLTLALSALCLLLTCAFSSMIVTLGLAKTLKVLKRRVPHFAYTVLRSNAALAATSIAGWHAHMQLQASLFLATVVAVAVALAPSSNFLFLTGFSTAERVMYIPLCLSAPLLANTLNAVWHGGRKIQGDGGSPAPLAHSWVAYRTPLAVLLAIAYTCYGMQKAAMWHDELALWSAAVYHAEHNAKAWYALGHTHLLAGRLPEARQALDHALQEHPTCEQWPQLRGGDCVYPDAVIDLTDIYLRQHDNVAARSVLETFFAQVRFERRCVIPPTASTLPLYLTWNYNSESSCAHEELLTADFTHQHDRFLMYGLLAINLGVLRVEAPPEDWPSARSALLRASSIFSQLPQHRHTPAHALALALRCRKIGLPAVSAHWTLAALRWVNESSPSLHLSRILRAVDGEFVLFERATSAQRIEDPPVMTRPLPMANGFKGDVSDPKAVAQWKYMRSAHAKLVAHATYAERIRSALSSGMIPKAQVRMDNTGLLLKICNQEESSLVPHQCAEVRETQAALITGASDAVSAVLQAISQSTSMLVCSWSGWRPSVAMLLNATDTPVWSVLPDLPDAVMSLSPPNVPENWIADILTHAIAALQAVVLGYDSRCTNVAEYAEVVARLRSLCQ